MLISCPNCGKPVSDKAEQCQHCKFILGTATIKPQETIAPKVENKDQAPIKVHKTVSQEKKDFYSLDKDDRDGLLLRFGVDEPLQYKVIHSKDINVKMQLIFGGIAILLSIVSLIILFTLGKKVLSVPNPSAIDFIIAFGGLGLSFILWIVFIIFIIILKATRQKFIFASKRFESWLNKRGIEGYAIAQTVNAIEIRKLQDLDL
ncbi:MAG: zinc ribbon domain-containing protein [Clostridia bacterium]|nr:zinc ribbon domain-containing protein [Clostridia bacterium]